MTTETILFDLDETLIVEQAADRASFDATCAIANARFGLPADRLYQAIIREAQALWQAGPCCQYCNSLGIASWEGLWGEFSGDHPKFPALRESLRDFPLQSWTNALASCGVDDADFAAELAAAFQQHRRGNHTAFPETHPLLSKLQGKYTLALITNGVPDIQWCKIKAVDLEKYFQTITISGELGIGKPDPRFFTATLAQLNADPQHTVVVGNSLGRDIQGAKNAHLRSIWLRTDDPEPATPTPPVLPDHQIDNLAELPPLL